MAEEFISHPLIKPHSMQHRLYQANILHEALHKNMLVVLPTGMGKTPIAILLAAQRLEKFPGSRALVLAPTRPLVNQHYKSFLRFMNIDPDRFCVVTGFVKPDEREQLYREKQLVFATPQTAQNDIENNRLNLADFSLLVTDEAHHSVGGYSYPFVAKFYLEHARHPRLLGLTASPGGTREKIREICANLGIEAVEIRTEHDADVAPYVQDKEVDWEYVELPESFLKIKSLIEGLLGRRVESLRKLRLVRFAKVSKKELLRVQGELMKRLRKGDRRAFMGLSSVTQAIKLDHALGLLESQGLPALESYWAKLRKAENRNDKALSGNPDIRAAMLLTNELLEQGSTHPKMAKLCSIVHQELARNKDSKIIVFASFRDTVKEVVSALSRVSGARPVMLVGQRTTSRSGCQSEGLTQKEQLQRIEEFNEGGYNIIVGTSISEEGLDIKSMDMAIFYEPVPSEIRTIQRRGRVGRHKLGRIIVLITRGTRDEAYFWAARAKEKEMHKTLHKIRGQLENEQKDLDDFGDSQ
ncbi:MAG: DEAD/DEAH box helicase [Candidatus Aenigmarchaeota archaeon]|nr:DEAD/DEAH box helicase [Candidatus Aenigmarchaeota archaeon]